MNEKLFIVIIGLASLTFLIVVSFVFLVLFLKDSNEENKKMDNTIWEIEKVIKNCKEWNNDLIKIKEILGIESSDN